MKPEATIFPNPESRIEHVIVKFRLGNDTTISFKTDDPDMIEKLVYLISMPGLTQCFHNSVRSKKNRTIIPKPISLWKKII